MGESADWEHYTAFQTAYARVTYPGIAHTGIIAVCTSFG